MSFVDFSSDLFCFFKPQLSRFDGIKPGEGRGIREGRLGSLEQMGRGVVNPSEVSRNGGESRDAKPLWVGGGHGGAAGRDHGLQFCFSFEWFLIFFIYLLVLFGSLSETFREGIFG